MHTIIRITRTEIPVTHLRITLPHDVMPDEDDGPLPFAASHTVGDKWIATIDLATGTIANWPAGQTADMFVKARDSGTYELLNAAGEVVATHENYPPKMLDECFDDDYVIFKIDVAGKIEGWRPERLDLTMFDDEV